MTTAEESLYWLGLSLTPGVGAVLFKRLLERFETPEAVFRAPLKDLVRIEGVGEKLGGEIKKGFPEKRVEDELRRLEEAGGSFLTWRNKAYPRRLLEIEDPPPVLYIRGEVKSRDELSVAVVGSRKTSPYGRMFAERISRDLVRHGVTIVSGMARGIDSVAHWGAITEGGRTIAVLGCGIDVVYPPENRSLFGRIHDQGAILSEFPMGSLPEGGHFPRRNRIISGMVLGVVVVEARKGSGSLITARYALEQGREVFAVPGNVGTEGSLGTNRLIKEGAKLVESSEDILEEILPQWSREKEIRQEGVPAGPVFSEEERRLLSLMEVTPVHIDRLIRESGIEAGRISSLLLELELKGAIVQWPGKCFSKKL